MRNTVCFAQRSNLPLAPCLAVRYQRAPSPKDDHAMKNSRDNDKTIRPKASWASLAWSRGPFGPSPVKTVRWGPTGEIRWHLRDRRSQV